MPAKITRVPPEWNSETWGRHIAPIILRGMPQQSRAQVPLDLAARLAALCDDADYRLRREAVEGFGPGWKLIWEAFQIEFGACLEFMARVREKWFDERGAVSAEDHSGESKVSGRIMKAGANRKIKAWPRTVAHWLRRREFSEWNAWFVKGHDRPPNRDEIARWLWKIGYDVDADQVSEGFRYLGKIIRKKTPSRSRR